MTIEQQLDELQKNALATGDFTDLQKFFDTPEYKALPYIVRNEGFVTAHKLKEFKRCAFCFSKRYIENMPSPLDEFVDSDPLVVGQAFDDLITEGEGRFKELYEVVARRSDKAEKKQLTKGMGQTIQQLKREFMANPLFSKVYKKKIMFTSFAGFILKIEMDDFDLENRIIKDAKTTASIERFRPEFYEFQGSFYQFVVDEVTGEKCDFVLEVADKNPGISRSAQYIYSRGTLEARRGELIQALEDLKLSMESGLFLPANNQEVLWKCPYYGVEGHGRPKKPFMY